VPADRFVDAHRLMELLDGEHGWWRSAVRCPECRSSRIKSPHVARPFAAPGLVDLLRVAGIARREFVCLDCQYTWPVAVPLADRPEPAGFKVAAR